MADQHRNLVAYLDGPGMPFRVAGAAIPEPAPDEISLRVHAVAINPADHSRQTLGFFIKSYPWTIGVDGAGTIAEVGSEVEKEGRLKVGDRVIAQSDEMKNQKPEHGMFQEYATLNARAVCKIPDDLTFQDGCVLPLGVNTAAGMLFEKETLQLSLPAVRSGGEKKKDDVVIVWGGSSSVGISAVQLASQAGYRVIGIARKNNFKQMEQAGADSTFDYTTDAMIDELCSFVETKGWTSAGVLNAVPNEPLTLAGCGEIAKRLPGKKFVSTALPRGIIPEPEMPEGVKASNCYALSDADILDYLWKEWIPEALKDRRLKCLPQAQVAGEGIESINNACDILRKGVSGKKIVVKVV